MLNSDDYKNKLVYPNISDYHLHHVYKRGEIILSNVNRHQLIIDCNSRFQKSFDSASSAIKHFQNNGFIVEINTDTTTFKQQQEVYNLEECKLHEKWKNDLSELYGIDLTNDPIGKILFSKAWDEGHATGLSNVESCLDELLDFIDQILKFVKVSNYAHKEMGRWH